jgi:hypothetical protein
MWTLTEQNESVFTLEQLKQLLSSVSPTTVLVGGQALVFWVDYYGITIASERMAEGISSDADLLGDRKLVRRIADQVHGKASYPPQNAITALVGQITIPINENEFLNVDVIDRVVGIEADRVRKRALQVALGDVQFLVMHPLDVLQSRIENLAHIQDKQTEEGIDQTLLAVAVARCYIEAIISEPDGQRLALKAIEYVFNLAKSGAGRKVSREFDIRFLPAIPVELIQNSNFHKQRWPQIVNELSES